MGSFYKKVYSKSWEMIKNNFYLLFFGLFVSILGFNEIKVILNLPEAKQDFISSNIISWAETIKAISISNITIESLPVLFKLILWFILFAIIIILVIASEGALIASVKQTGNNAKKKFKKYLQIGVEKFWPLLGINLINTLIGYFFILLIVEPLLYFTINMQTSLFYLLLSLVIFFILIPIVIIISFVTRYGAAYIILKNQNLWKAFVNGWSLFKINWLITIENALLVLFVTILFYIVLFMAITISFVPFLIISIIVNVNVIIFWIAITLGGVLGVSVFLLGSALYGAYYNIVWANLFLELTSPGKNHGKLHRVVKKHFPKLV